MSESSQQTTKLKAALEALRALGINVRGPFAALKQNQVYVVDYCFLTPSQIVALHESGKFKPETIEQSLADLADAGHAVQTHIVARSKSLQRAQHREAYPENHRRSQRVMLRLNVLVRVEMQEGERQTHALTVRVNAHGGLMESPFRMTVGQRIALINPQSGKEVGCTVVGVQATSGGYFSIAFEFAQPSARFWEVAFPPPDWEMSEEPA